MELSIMPKELRDAPVTEVRLPCPACHETLIVSVRVASNEIAVGCISQKMWDVNEAILAAVDRAAPEKFCDICEATPCQCNV